MRLLKEGKLVAKRAFQVEVDATVIASRSLTTGVFMRRDSWLQSLGFPREVKNTMQDLPFDESNLFIEKTDDSLHLLKTQARPVNHDHLLCLLLSSTDVLPSLNANNRLRGPASQSPPPPRPEPVPSPLLGATFDILVKTRLQ